MLRYETLMLVRTEITNEEVAKLEKDIEKMVTPGGGSVVAFDKRGKYRLAYPVQKHEYGIYILVRYNVPRAMASKVAQDIAQYFRITSNEVVMRHVTVALPKNAPVDYKFPEPVDSPRAGSVDAFLRENKIDGMLSQEARSQATAGGGVFEEFDDEIADA